MNILVIGANGFIGGNALRFFEDKGHEVTGCDVIFEKSLQKHYKTILLNPIQPDFESLFTQIQYDICINASGLAHVGFSFDNPAKDFELNVLNVNKLLVCIRRFNPKCKFINLSSAAVYGNPVKLPISEDADLKPLSPYGFHKLQSEYLLTEYHKFFGLHTCTLRIFSAFGPRLRKQLFWDLYQNTLKGEKLELFGTGEESRDFIYIDDLLSAIDLVIDQAAFQGDIINVASGYEIKIKDAVQIFYHLLDPKLTFTFSGKVKIGDPNNWQADIGQLKRLGFSPEYSLEEGLKTYVQWLKESR
jgi:dTDP-glucose 4,6-dehydratase/UDP-glucose 4-epimerase